MSRFARVPEFGEGFALEVARRVAPHAGRGRLRVRVRAAGLNPVDWKIAAWPDLAGALGLVAPSGFGNDFAGEVDEVGEGVGDYRVGDRVFGGALARAVADHVVVTPGVDVLHRTPGGLDDVRAGALCTVGRTAAAAVAAAGMTAGEVVLVGGAAGGVGVLAVQLAVAAGATVIGTGSAASAALLRALGAVPVTYGEGLEDRVRALAPRGVDAAIDLHGIETVEAALALGVAPSRVIAIAAGGLPEGVVSTGSIDAPTGVLDELAHRLVADDLVLPVQETFPLERIGEAVARQRAGHVHGKLVVVL